MVEADFGQLLTCRRWNEVSRRDEFWQDFEKKVPESVLRYRLQIKINTGNLAPQIPAKERVILPAKSKDHNADLDNGQLEADNEHGASPTDRLLRSSTKRPQPTPAAVTGTSSLPLSSPLQNLTYTSTVEVPIARRVGDDGTTTIEHGQTTAAAASSLPQTGALEPKGIGRRTSSTMVGFQAEQPDGRSGACVKEEYEHIKSRASLTPDVMEQVERGKSVEQEPWSIKKEASHDEEDIRPSTLFVIKYRGESYMISESDIYTAHLGGSQQDLVDIDGTPVMVHRASLKRVGEATHSVKREASEERQPGKLTAQGGIKREQYNPDLDGELVMVDDSDD
jgi:hypothetical protein